MRLTISFAQVRMSLFRSSARPAVTLVPAAYGLSQGKSAERLFRGLIKHTFPEGRGH